MTLFYAKNMNTVEEYIATFNETVASKLKEIRAIILSEAPEADEYISYKMPAYKYKGKPLVYFAGYAKHIGFYALPTGHDAFKAELSGFKQGKGSVQFPLNEPLPEALIRKMIAFRMQQNEENK